MDWVEVTFGIFEALGRSFVVVEGYTGADNVEDRTSGMGQSTLDQGRELFAVAGKTTRNVSRAEGNCQLGHVDGRNVIDLSSLHDRTDISGGGELPLSKSVDAIIFYNLSDIHV